MVYVVLHTEDDGAAWESDSWQVVRAVYAEEERARRELEVTEERPDKRLKSGFRKVYLHSESCCEISPAEVIGAKAEG